MLKQLAPLLGRGLGALAEGAPLAGGRTQRTGTGGFVFPASPVFWFALPVVRAASLRLSCGCLPPASSRQKSRWPLSDGCLFVTAETAHRK